MDQEKKPTLADGNLYLLIDAAQYPGIWRVLQYRFRRLPWLSLFEDTSDIDAVMSGPVLIKVDTDQTKTLAWFLEHTQDLHCLSWITSALSLVALRGHLSGLMQVVAEDGAECAMRYYDTRILPAWVAMLDDWQKRHVLGPIASWTLINRDGMAHSIAGNAENIAPTARLLHLNQRQEQALLHAALPDAVITALQDAGNADLLTLAEGRRHAFISEQIAKARSQYSIETIAELVMFCTLALALGDKFDQTSSVASMLTQFGNDAARYVPKHANYAGTANLSSSKHPAL